MLAHLWELYCRGMEKLNTRVMFDGQKANLEMCYFPWSPNEGHHVKSIGLYREI